ncbi:MAG: efflux RND transporter periplasmic adaptor subunit [Shewanella sp.]
MNSFNLKASSILLGLSLSMAMPSAMAQAEASSQDAAITTSTSSNAEQHYYCPMHPQETSHEPGRCPICKMFLVKDEEEEASAVHQHQDAGATSNIKTLAPIKELKPLTELTPTKVKYVCPMHPHIVSDQEGSCPICGMDLEPVNMATSATEIEVNVSGNMQQALALRVAPATRGTLWKYVRAVGSIDYDQRLIEHIHPRVSGWVEKLNVESAGDKIKQGQLLYELYSPELINAQNDYLLAMETLAQNNNSKNYQQLVRNAGLRLELLGFNAAQIKQLASTKQTQFKVPFYAKRDAVVETLNIRDGMYVEPQTEIISLVDLSKVWVVADVFENEQSWLALGQEAEISIPALNISDMKGKIDYIYPELDPITRSLRVRVVLSNPDASLRPKTLANVAFFGGAKRDALYVPSEALIQTGKQNRVIVKQGDTSFVAKEVVVGMQTQGKSEIISGLNDGEMVVTSGQFLLDSEASLKGSLLRLSQGHQH